MHEDAYKGLSLDERRQAILEILSRKGKARVTELAVLFAISEVTIRSDLDELGRQGLLERVHGGAVSTYRAYYNLSFAERAKANETEKKAIAKSVGELISGGDTVMLNSGTTTLAAMQFLKHTKDILVVTNSIAIAQEADRCPNIEVILLGGHFNTSYQFTYGDDTLNQLKKYQVDKLILACNGVTKNEGVGTYFASEAEIDRQMMERANCVILAADHTKIGRVGFTHVAPIENVDILVTNSGANPVALTEIERCGVQIITA